MTEGLIMAPHYGGPFSVLPVAAEEAPGLGKMDPCCSEGTWASMPTVFSNLDQQSQPQKDISHLPGNHSVTWEKGDQCPGPRTC